MSNTETLNILVCPNCKEPLQYVSSNSIADLKLQSDNKDLSSITEGYLCKKDNRLFVVEDGVPLLLLSDSITVI